MIHARLSASSAHRWLKCAGSIPAQAGLPDQSSVYAAEGTFAHDIAAKCLDKNIDAHGFLGHKGRVEGHDFICDQEMVDGVQVYLDAVREDAKPGDINKAEMPLLEPLSKIDADLGGTADFARYRPSAKHIRVFDFKYGSGKYVEVDSNEQMMLYALGVMLTFNAPVVEVEVTIVQPRFEGAAPIRSWTFKAADIIDFIADVREAAVLSRQPFAPLAAGSWCGFCKAAATCTKLEEKHHALVAADFGTLADFSKLAAALTSIPLVKERIKAIEEYAYQQACNGAEIPGYKLVDKIAHRSWKDEAETVKWAEANGINPYEKPELKSPAAIEKLVAATMPKGKKKEAAKVIEPLTQKISSGTALVLLGDNRPPAKLITANDFTVIEGTATAATPAFKL